MTFRVTVGDEACHLSEAGHHRHPATLDLLEAQNPRPTVALPPEVPPYGVPAPLARRLQFIKVGAVSVLQPAPREENYHERT
jgi:hypothetical protein